MTKGHHISQLEAINAMFGVKVLSTNYPPWSHIEVMCNNIAAVWTFVAMSAKDRVLLAAARALWFWANDHQLTISFTHKSGSQLILADSLSRESIGREHRILSDKIIKEKSLKRFHPDFKFLNYSEFL